jgi:asparaginyl-tRNA synthetase
MDDIKTNVIRIEQALSMSDGEKAVVRGWVYRARSSGGMVFAVLRDSSGIMQVTIKKDKVGETLFEDAKKAALESSIIVSGAVKTDARAPGGKEIQVDDLKIVHFSHEFPITEYQSAEFLLDVRHLWLRSQKLTKVFKARSFILKYLREFYESREFWELAPPIITKSGCEGGSTLFELNYFGEKAYLSQSAQLYNEAFITSLEKVFVVAPSFRAEKSRTTKHLTEYWHLEEEAAWFDNEDNMRLQEEMLEYVAQKLVSNNSTLLAGIEGADVEALKKIRAPFNRLSYDDAVKKIAQVEPEFKWGDDFGTNHERILTQGLDKPVFVFNWPAAIKPFYMQPHEDGVHVKNADCLAPNGHGEIIGGSERIWELDLLLKRMKEQKLDTKEYEWYIDLRKYGSVPHSGFGLGIERLVKWMLNLEHIRDAVPFPRVINRAYP